MSDYILIFYFSLIGLILPLFIITLKWLVAPNEKWKLCPYRFYKYEYTYFVSFIAYMTTPLGACMYLVGSLLWLIPFWILK
jgi:hypothetical protein